MNGWGIGRLEEGDRRGKHGNEVGVKKGRREVMKLGRRGKRDGMERKEEKKGSFEGKIQLRSVLCKRKH